MKIKKYLKWLFTRWYLYVLTIFLFLEDYETQNYFMIEVLIARLLTNLIFAILIISFFASLNKGRSYLLKKSKDQ